MCRDCIKTLYSWGVQLVRGRSGVFMEEIIMLHGVSDKSLVFIRGTSDLWSVTTENVWSPTRLRSNFLHTQVEARHFFISLYILSFALCESSKNDGNRMESIWVLLQKNCTKPIAARICMHCCSHVWIKVSKCWSRSQHLFDFGDCTDLRWPPRPHSVLL